MAAAVRTIKRSEITRSRFSALLWAVDLLFFAILK